MRGLVAFLCLACAPLAAAAAAPRPVEAYARLPFLESPQLSPDGSKFAARMASNGELFLVIVPLDKADGPPRRIPLGGSDLNWWRWINDDWLLLGVGAEDQVEGRPWYITRVLTVKADGGKINRIGWADAGQNADDLVWVATDGSPRFLLAMQTSIYMDNIGFWPKVFEVDAATGKMRKAVDPRAGVVGWYADAGGTVRMGIGYGADGRRSKLLYRDRDGENFRTVERADRRKGEALLVPAMFLPEPGKALALSDDDKGFTALWELDLATLERGKQLSAVPGYDLDGIIADPSGARLLGVEVTEQGPSVRWLDPEMAEVQTAIDTALKGWRGRIVSMNRDRSRLLVHVDRADHPGSYFIFERATGTLVRFAWVDEAMKGQRGHPVKSIRYKARDGLEIEALLTLPTGREAKALPLIVMPHGGPFARDQEGWDWWAQFLADRGYAVVQPNYRGSSGYGTEFAKKGQGQWGLAMQDDLNDAVTHLAKQGVADPRRVCMVGASYGGYAAFRAAQRDGALYRCAVSYAGVSDLPRMRSYDSRFLFSGAASDWLREQAPDLRAVSPIAAPAQFSIPLLVMHGKLDRRVPVSQSRELVEKLKAAGKPVDYVEQPEGDHFFSREQDRLDFLNRLEAFLAKHNPA